ncbi:Aldose 1-epimerase [Pleurostoma richardsiae]|uniref:Aldose 1-epimerase n=1 Tax=Pleurostoma richardsiae TaxID=41990 RepID=A0AA38S812_9PEZI|nr:Aldose 1-epimerase [Pleurostoma richardsiae]
MRLSAALLVITAAIRSEAAITPDADGRYTISSNSIRAQFIPYGATLTNLFVKDKDGKDVDVVLGYDNTSYYPVDPGHPVYNSIPGRYVNRIGNGHYTLDGKVYETEKNDGNNTLHSGTNNWSYRAWNVTAISSHSITFNLSDPAFASKGMPGIVNASVTYSVTNTTWRIKMLAIAPETRTPLMLTQHTYFNLDAFKNPATAQIWNHTLHLPYSERYLEGDDGALPTGKILTAAPGSISDFASAPDMLLGHARNDPKFAGNCGAGGACEGYNGYWIIDEAPKDAIVATLASSWSGIKAELRTDQAGVVVYSCNWMDGTAALKSTQGTSSRKTVGGSSCIAIEAQDWVDGINHPEWNRTEAEITGPGEGYAWESSWTFGTL